MRPVGQHGAGMTWDTEWPKWPADVKPADVKSLVNVVVHCNVDKLFSLLWGARTEFMVRPSCRPW